MRSSLPSHITEIRETSIIFRAPSRTAGEEIVVLTEEITNLEGTGIALATTLRFFSDGESEAIQSARYHDARGENSSTTGESLVVPYHRMMLGCLVLVEPQLHQADCRVLVIGLGGGALVSAIDHLLPVSAAIDAVEIDSGVVYLATKYFGFDPTERVKVFVKDGLEWLRSKVGLYDVILLDTDEKMTEQSEIRLVAPAREFCDSTGVDITMAALKKSGGLLVLNIVPHLDHKVDESRLKSVLDHYSAKSSGAACIEFSVAGSSEPVGNKILLATRGIGSVGGDSFMPERFLASMQSFMSERADVNTITRISVV